MRTKLLLGAAAIAASAITASAANVYSLNVVGYYNVAAPSGYTLMANQLKAGNNTIKEVIPAAPDEALVLTFANNAYTWNIAMGGDWFDYYTTEPSTTVLPPGTGFFYSNPGADSTVTFVGEVPQGALSLPLGTGYTLVGCQTPQALALTAANNFPVADEALVLTFANNAYKWNIMMGGEWFDYYTTEPVTMVPAVGQGWFYNNPGAATAWARNFTVQ